LPSEGSAFHLLARTAERAGDRAEAARAVESVATGAGRPEIRAAWLVQAARVAGEGPESAKYRVDVLLRAAVASPTAAAIALLRDAVHDVLKSDPDEHEGLEMRLGRAARTIGMTLQGPEGARVAIAIASLAVEVLGDAETGLAALERAFGCDSDVPEFAVLAARGEALARAQDARQRVASLLSAAEAPLAGGGVAALRVLSNMACALGDATLHARAAVAAALRDPSDDELVVAADAATRNAPELGARLASGLSSERRAEALHALARAHAASGARADAARLLERVFDLVEGESRAEVEAELRALRSSTAPQTEVEQAARRSSASEVSSLRTRAERWSEIAARREARADAVGAVRALLEACKLDPESLGRWSALERVAEIASDDQARVLALEQIAKRVGVEGRVAVFKRLARAHSSRNDSQAAERVWREVLALDSADEEADQAIESLFVTTSRYTELADHLALRAARLNSDPSRSESLRAVRLRRAAILDQRLGRANDACEELERLLSEAPDNSGALRYLADLLERLGQHARAAPLWARAAAAEPSVEARNELEERAGRAWARAGDFSTSLEHARRVLAHDPKHRAALELRRRAAEALGADVELGETLEQLAGEAREDAVSQSELLVEAALVAARAGDLDRALVRARRAARAAPEQATPQLLARGLEYRLRGAGTPGEARATIDELARIGQPLGADDVALRSFLLAEALDVIRGGGAGMRELEQAQALVGAHPLIALGLAERLSAQGHAAAAVDAYRATLAGGPLLGLRAPGKVALSAADTAIVAGRRQDASYFLDLAERDEELRAAVVSRRARLKLGYEPPPDPPIVTGSNDRSLEALQVAIHDATGVRERALARFALGQARLEQGDERGAKRLLLDALADGLADAGDALVTLLASSPDYGRDLIQIRYQQVVIDPGDIGRLESLRAAALADGDIVHASAAEHVLRAFDPTGGPLLPPALASQSERSGILTLLARQSMDPAGEALALLWDGASDLFARDAASYSVTGVERVVPGPTSAIARLYDAAVRVLDTPRIPLFVPRSGTGAPKWRVALLQPPSVILTGDVREETSEMRFELGRGLCAALPHNVLRLGLPGAEGRRVIEALQAAFGPSEIGRRVDAPTARMAESLWQVLPPPTQRRTQQLLASGSFPDYGELLARAHQSGLRVGMFLAGDFGIAARMVLAESGTRVDAPTPDNLRDLCQGVPALADLLRLAINPQYANARWRDEEDAAASRSPSGRFSLF
jgi:tetratricopeptide (TPR) repeat protein